MPKVFGLEHIVYLVIFIALAVSSIVFIKLKVKSDKTIEYIIKGVAVFLLALILWNRISLAIYKGPINLIPNTFCGITSLLFSLSAIFFKRNNIVFHFFVYMALWGCTLVMIYPNFIGQAESVFYPPTISGLMHHSVALYLAVLMIVTGYFKPTIRKFYAYPIGLSFYMSYGLFLMDCIGLDEAMYIHEPLIEGTIFTWYFVGFLICVVTAAILLVYDYILKKKHSANYTPEDKYIN